MSDNSKYNKEAFDNDNVDANNDDNVEVVDNFDALEDGEETAEEIDPNDVQVTGEEASVSELDAVKAELEKLKKEYLFLMAEFDNFRKRTLREKSDLIKNGGEQALKGLLPIIDDFERGIKASESADVAEDVLEGMKLIYNKFIKYLAANGVKEFDPGDRDFNPDRHEAISVVPVQDESQKGKILDTVEKGYTLNDKVLRHAKVVVGQ
ncbi:MAG: nucleotide exchange factor GrpE [Clostridium sp.]|nr:nucleotide exchange factor GrpE [Prevotella sp.]MCM1429406.1 nucleotide exchange factor GrpE [Clostridium sp.]